MAKQPRKPRIPDLESMLKQLGAEAMRVMKTETRAFAEQERQGFIDAIRRQEFPAFTKIPLARRTKARKKRLGLGDKTMIATGEYLDSIRVYNNPLQGARRGETVAITIHENKRARDAESGELRPDVSMALVAMVQEYGSQEAGVPARPHWRPYFLRMRPRAEKLKARIRRLVRELWRKRMGR